MLVLDNTTSSIKMQAGSNPGTAIPVYVSYYDEDYNPGHRNSPHEGANVSKQHSTLASGDTVAVTILTAPSTGFRRKVLSIWFYNAAAGQVTYKLQMIDSAATPTTVEHRYALQSGDTFLYEDGKITIKNSAGHTR